jgi:hypothetical protein
MAEAAAESAGEARGVAISAAHRHVADEARPCRRPFEQACCGIETAAA